MAILNFLRCNVRFQIISDTDSREIIIEQAMIDKAAELR